MKLCRDHLGNTYNSIVELCKKYEITVSAYRTRYLYGNYSLEYTLTTPLKNGNKRNNYYTIVKDHLDNEYSTKTEMCKTYGISVYTFYSRINSGWDLEKALTTPTKEEVKGISCKDHNGKVFKSIKEMCNYHNIVYTTFYNRIKSGWNLKDALTKGIETREYK